MTIERRTLSKGVAAGSALLIGGTAAWTAAAHQRSHHESRPGLATVYLRTGTALDDEFIRGIQLARQSPGRPSLSAMMLKHQP